MGIGPKFEPTHEDLIYSHVHSMRKYAEELDNESFMIKRRLVVERILKCADELQEASKKLGNKYYG